ncbi:MAG: MarR family transcriptional regulator [Anaerolineae bacterium]|nr:MarR family transcriptional regulator [Anaerolineae bacterium]
MGEVEELVQSIVQRLLTLMRYQHRYSHRVRDELHMSGRQLSILRYLVEMGPRSVGEISRRFHIRDGTTSPLLDRLEEQGYIQRRRCSHDNRRVLVEATEKGREIIGHAPLGAIDQLRAQLPDLPLEELQIIDQALQRLSEIALVDETLLT